jgi:glycosyltransferase involved in cell wall biosynthesis
MVPRTILHTEASLGWGGQEIRIVRESAGMSKRGHRVIIAAPPQSAIFNRAPDDGLEVLPAEFRKKSPGSISKMVSLIKRVRPDFVNTHSSSDSWVSSIAAKLSGSRPKIIRTRHLSTPISRSFLSRMIYDMLPDAVMTTGEEIRQRMIQANGFRASNIFSVPTGIDLHRFDPEKTVTAFKTESFAVGMVGVLWSWKGHLFFLKAIPEILKHVGNAHFYIAGDGPQRENIENAIREMSLREHISLLGHREDVPEIMAALDLIVHPSYANEGIPQSILQAFAMRKPVIASDTGAIREIVIDRETGLLIKPGDPMEIAESVIELYNNTELMTSLGNEGRRLVVREHSIEKMLDKIEDLYGRLLNDE